MRKDDISAFPVIPPVDSDGYMAGGYPYPDTGMTLRDFFAIKCYSNILNTLQNTPNWNDDGFTNGAMMAYKMADLLIQAREI